MSDAPDDDDERPVNEGIIRGQIEKCKEKLGESIEDRIDVTTEDDIYQDIDGFLGQVEDATVACFSDRYHTSVLFDQLKFFFRAIIKEREFEEKLFRRQDRIEDNPVNLYRWFKLYATVALNESVEMKYAFAIEQFNIYREDDVSHPTSLPSPGQETDPTLLSSILLIWYAIEDLLDFWGRVLDLEEEQLSDNLQSLLDDSEFQIGYVKKLEDERGFVNSYQEGEGGTSLRIEPQHVSYFVSEGDIVRFETPSDFATHQGDVYNPDSDEFEVEKFP